MAAEAGANRMIAELVNVTGKRGYVRNSNITDVKPQIVLMENVLKYQVLGIANVLQTNISMVNPVGLFLWRMDKTQYLILPKPNLAIL